MTILHHSRSEDDFGQPIHREEGELLYDAPTTSGPWAIMTEASWKYHRRTARLGTGLGQAYRYDGSKFVKVAG